MLDQVKLVYEYEHKVLYPRELFFDGSFLGFVDGLLRSRAGQSPLCCGTLMSSGIFRKCFQLEGYSNTLLEEEQTSWTGIYLFSHEVLSQKISRLTNE